MWNILMVIGVYIITSKLLGDLSIISANARRQMDQARRDREGRS